MPSNFRIDSMMTIFVYIYPSSNYFFKWSYVKDKHKIGIAIHFKRIWDNIQTEIKWIASLNNIEEKHGTIGKMIDIYIQEKYKPLKKKITYYFIYLFISFIWKFKMLWKKQVWRGNQFCNAFSIDYFFILEA